MEVQTEIGTCVMCRKRKTAYYFNCKEGSREQKCRTTDIQEKLWRLK
jgi:hypothetical protein